MRSTIWNAIGRHQFMQIHQLFMKVPEWLMPSILHNGAGIFLAFDCRDSIRHQYTLMICARTQWEVTSCIKSPPHTPPPKIQAQCPTKIFLTTLFPLWHICHIDGIFMNIEANFLKLLAFNVRETLGKIWVIEKQMNCLAERGGPRLNLWANPFVYHYISFTDYITKSITHRIILHTSN